MDRPISENQHHPIACDHQLDDAAAKTSRLAQVNGLDVELEFVEDKENRWNKIFELLEGEDYAQ
jgi:hypothetical protein